MPAICCSGRWVLLFFKSRWVSLGGYMLYLGFFSWITDPCCLFLIRIVLQPVIGWADEGEILELHKSLFPLRTTLCGGSRFQSIFIKGLRGWQPNVIVVEQAVVCLYSKPECDRQRKINYCSIFLTDDYEDLENGMGTWKWLWWLSNYQDKNLWVLIVNHYSQCQWYQPLGGRKMINKVRVWQH